MASAIGLLPYKSAAEVEKEDEDKRKAQEANKAEADKTVSGDLQSSLLAYITPKWTDAKDAKLAVEVQMLKSVMQKRGEYDFQKLAEIRSVEQPEIFMNITETKCANAEAQIKDIIIQPGKRIFSADPSPIPELPDEITRQIQEAVMNQYIQMAVAHVQQGGQAVSPDDLRSIVMSQIEEIKAKVHEEILKRAKKMAEAIEDRIDEDWILGGFYSALEEVVQDIVSLKAGFIKGPVFRKRKVKKTKRDPETGKLSKSIEEKIIPEYERRSPFCIFPSPRSTSIDNGYLFDVILLSPHQLHSLIGVDGFNEKEIKAVLAEFESGTIKTDWLNLSNEAKEGMGEEDRRKMKDHYPYESIYCLEFWDEIPGKLLKEWGLNEPSITSDEDTYPACVWMINTHIIKAMLNYDEIGHKPFACTSFQKENDSFWGHGVPEKIEDCQQVCNACARAIVANVGIASGPLLDLNIDRLEPGASRKIWPWRVFPTTDEQMAGGSKALNFYQPTMVTEKLINVYQTFSKIADEHSGVPAFSHGDSQVGGGGNTASGLYQLREMASVGIRAVVRNIDIDVIIPCVEAHYEYVLDNMEVYGLVGDYVMSAQGTTALMAKQQLTMRKTEFLQSTANPFDIQLIGPDNRRKMLFEVAKALGIDLEQSPVPVFAGQPQIGAPPPRPTSVDEAGQPTQGTDNRLASPSAPRAPTPPVEGRQAGGPVEAGKPYLVGEKGPEVIVPDKSGKVIPNYGLREDGTPKSTGWLGMLRMTDGSDKLMSELSVGVNIDGKEHLIPSIVPTLSQDELDHLRGGGHPTPEILRKASDFAQTRIKMGLSPFRD